MNSKDTRASETERTLGLRIESLKSDLESLEAENADLYDDLETKTAFINAALIRERELSLAYERMEKAVEDLCVAWLNFSQADLVEKDAYELAKQDMEHAYQSARLIPISPSEYAKRVRDVLENVLRQLQRAINGDKMDGKWIEAELEVRALFSEWKGE